ncbi:hypothetical protein GIB67_017066 [Kingdonia uniflora]|uniref:Methyltransferase n=1 Tax=Kingdonia uniflora TaxID=39325 RepID=A0A7J7NCQ7_9MAGN|nr:hypothetical protein GIB67_017066 [Kingdonia uniflora]
MIALFVLLLCITTLLLNNDRYPYINPTSSTTNLISSSSFPTVTTTRPPDSNPKKSKPKTDEIESNPITNVLLNWKVCNGTVATDYIPCLDNKKAIKALQSRRHMEHRERHCPSGGLKCLIPIPKGYKIPVPWPKSKDMVRLVLFGKSHSIWCFVCMKSS